MWTTVMIDDDRQVLQSMKKMIPWQKLGAECVGEALDGQQGLKLIQQLEPDIVITDIYMPVMNGLDMIQELQNASYSGKIIILSGYSDFEYARQALRLNVNDYLSKPASLQTIQNVLSRVISELERAERELEERQLLHAHLRTYEPFVKKEWIKSVLTGTYDQSEELPLLLDKSILYQPLHLVMAIEIVRTERVCNVTVQDWRLFRFAVHNIVQEVLQKQGLFFDYVELHANHAAVWIRWNEVAKHQEAILMNHMYQIAEQLIHNVVEYLQIQLVIGFGTFQSSWNRLAQSTEEAFMSISMKRAAVSSEKEIYAYGQEDDMRSEGTRAVRLHVVKFYQELAEAIRQGQEQRSRELVHQFVAEMKQTEQCRPVYVRKIAMEVWAILKYTLYEIGIVLDELVPAEQLAMEWNELSHVKALEVWLNNKIELISSRKDWNDNLKHRQVIEFMMDYIHEHYAEDITLSELAEKVYISRNYLSHIFRKATGETFNSYLTRVRMEKARGMILEGKYLIYEIAEKVGYKNVPYFSTLFKKTTGLNPSELYKRL